MVCTGKLYGVVYLRGGMRLSERSTISTAIVRDLFSDNECARVYSFLNSTIALSPLLAPSIGGYLAHWFNWRFSFAFLIFLGIIIFILAHKNIDETLNPKNKRMLSGYCAKHFGMYTSILMGIGGAFLMGAGAGGAISIFPEMAGAASALFGCLQFVFARIFFTFVR